MSAGVRPRRTFSTNRPLTTVAELTYSWRRPSIPLLIVLGAVAIYTWYFTKRTLDIHHALGTSSYDSALYDQGMWLLSRFQAPFSTLMGRNVFGDHTSFVLFFLVPFYWLFPGAGIMFFAQSLAIGAGAIPVFLYGRRRLGSEWFAIVGAATYLLHPAVSWTNLENFHPDAFLGVFVGFAIYAALESKWRLYIVFVVLSLLVKEDASLVIVPLGIWVAIKRDRRIGVLTIVGSVAFMITAMYLVMRNLIGVPTRNAWRIPFGGPRGVIDTALTNPTQLTEYLSTEERPRYIWQMTAPFAFLFLRLPSVAAISALVLFTNILSTFWYQHQIEYHYSLIAVPALSIGTVYAIGAVRERVEWSGQVVPLRAVAVLVLGVVTLITAYLWAPLPWGLQRPFEGDPSRAGRGRRPRVDGRDPRRRRRVGQLPAHAAPGVSGGDLPVPDAVPGGAVRARHVDRGVTPGGPCRPGRVRDAPDRAGRSAAGRLGLDRPGVRPRRLQRLLAPLPTRPRRRTRPIRLASLDTRARSVVRVRLGSGPNRLGQTELSGGRGGGGRGGRR